MDIETAKLKECVTVAWKAYLLGAHLVASMGMQLVHEKEDRWAETMVG